MKVAIPKEVVPGERRVAGIAATVKTYVQWGMEVFVEAGAGVAAYMPDSAYEQAGAKIVANVTDLLGQADLVLKVQPPARRADGLDELALIRPGSILVCLLTPNVDLSNSQRIAQAGITSFAMDAVPRITRAQSMDALTSMSTISGYKAVLLAADHLGKMMPMMMTAAGTIQPAEVMVIGAGVAGLQAVATARRLGAKVRAVDPRPAVKEQVESLGARFIHLEVVHEQAQAAQGYAKDLGETFYRYEQETIAAHLKDVDIVICTALIPGRPAPILITDAMVAAMKPGAVIVDLAILAGGNCAVSKADQAVQAHQALVLAPTNLPSSLPLDSSQMYARNIAAFLGELIKDGQPKLDLTNEVIRGMLITHEGKVMFPPAAAPEDRKGGLS